jgi:hypothetical protein
MRAHPDPDSLDSLFPRLNRPAGLNVDVVKLALRAEAWGAKCADEWDVETYMSITSWKEHDYRSWTRSTHRIAEASWHHLVWPSLELFIAIPPCAVNFYQLTRELDVLRSQLSEVFHATFTRIAQSRFQDVLARRDAQRETTFLI